MAVLKSPKNQSSKRTWIRLFCNRTKYLKFISKKAYFNKNFSVIPLKWNSIYSQYPPQPFHTPLENTYFSVYIYHYLLRSKVLPIKNSQFFITASKTYLWHRASASYVTFRVLKVHEKKINWLMVPDIN